MDIIINKVFDKLKETSQIANITFSVNELTALETVAYIFSQELINVRETAKVEGKAFDIEQSLFIDSLVSAYIKLNDSELNFV